MNVYLNYTRIPSNFFLGSLETEIHPIAITALKTQLKHRNVIVTLKLTNERLVSSATDQSPARLRSTPS